MDPGAGSPAANAAGYLWQTQALLKALKRTLHQLCTQPTYVGDSDPSFNKLRLSLASAAATFSEDCLRDLLNLASCTSSWCNDPTSRLSYRRCCSALASLQYSMRQEHLLVAFKRLRRECSSKNIHGIRGTTTAAHVLCLASKLEENIAGIVESYAALINPVPTGNAERPDSSNQVAARSTNSGGSSSRGTGCAPCSGSSFNYTSQHGLQRLQDACCAFLEVCQPLLGQLAAYEESAVHLEVQHKANAATTEAAAATADAKQRAAEVPKRSASRFSRQFASWLMVTAILSASTGVVVHYVHRTHEGAAARAIVEEAVAHFAAQANTAVATVDAEHQAQLSAAHSHIEQLEAELRSSNMEAHSLKDEVHDLSLVVKDVQAEAVWLKGRLQDSSKEIHNASIEVGILKAGFSQLRTRMMCQPRTWVAWAQSTRSRLTDTMSRMLSVG